MTRQKAPRKPRLISLCSGIGGIDLAWEMAGGEIAGQCELDDYCQRVLARHWPDVKRVADIHNVWGDSFDGAIDCIAAGFPCQPASVAGQRRGAADTRWLWPEVLRVVQVYEPAWLLLENVSGLISLGLDTVLADLDAAGYEAWPVVFPAAAVGAPHQRERIFIVAHAHRERREWRQGGAEWLDGNAHHRERQEGTDLLEAAGARSGDDVANADQHSGRWAQRAECGDVDGAAGANAAREGHLQRATAQCSRADVADDDGQRPQRDIQLHRATQTRQQVSARCQTRGCDADDARQWQAQHRMGGDADGLSRRLDGAGFVDLCPPRHAWPAGPGHLQHEWEPPRVTQERIPNRAARLKALGNSVVPQQIYPILKAICFMWQEEQDALHSANSR